MVAHLNLFIKLLSGAVLGFATSFVSDVALWLKTPGGWKANPFDVDVASKRWVLGALGGFVTASGFHIAGF